MSNGAITDYQQRPCKGSIVADRGMQTDKEPGVGMYSGTIGAGGMRNPGNRGQPPLFHYSVVMFINSIPRSSNLFKRSQKQ
jgi:hypothetical protein